MSFHSSQLCLSYYILLLDKVIEQAHMSNNKQTTTTITTKARQGKNPASSSSTSFPQPCRTLSLFHLLLVAATCCVRLVICIRDGGCRAALGPINNTLDTVVQHHSHCPVDFYDTHWRWRRLGKGQLCEGQRN